MAAPASSAVYGSCSLQSCPIAAPPLELSMAALELTVAYENTCRTHCNVNFINIRHFSTNFLGNSVGVTNPGPCWPWLLIFLSQNSSSCSLLCIPFLCFGTWTGRKPECTGPASRILCINYAHIHFNMRVKTWKHIFDGEGIQWVKGDKASVTPPVSLLTWGRPVSPLCLTLTSLPDSGT